MGYLYLLLALILVVPKTSVAQTMLMSNPFSSNSSFLEPDERRGALKISNDEFITLAKVKGTMNGASDLVLEKYDNNLKNIYTVPIKVGPDEDIKDMFFNGKDLILFSTVHELGIRKSTLKAYVHDISSGAVKEEKILFESNIEKYQDVKFKGAVKESYENSILSCLNQNFIIPFQFQYEIKFSPDKKTFLAYIYDYGQKNLVANARLFDTQLDQILSVEVPIDNNFINYGIYPNNRGDLYVLNVDRIGRIVLVQFDTKGKDHKLLDIQYANSNRDNLRIHIHKDDIVFVANTNVKNGEVLGVMYSKFNFEKNLIEKVNFHEFDKALKQTVNTAREVNTGIYTKEDWKNYEITHFIVNEFEKIILVLEKRELVGNNFRYDGSSVNSIDKWYEKPAKLSTEGVMIFSFNSNNELIWENFYLKMQVSDVNSGLLSNSFVLDNSEEGKLRMVFAASEGAVGMLTGLRYVEWDEYSGNRLKDISLDNKLKLSLLRNYVLWWDNKLLLVGRKGVIGKKTFMNLYELN